MRRRNPIPDAYPWLRHSPFVVLVACAVALTSLATVARAGATEPEVSRSMGRRFDRVATLVEQRYYARDFHGIDWRALCARYRPEALAAPDVGAWYATVNSMLSELGDAHTRLELPGHVDGLQTGPARIADLSGAVERDAVVLKGGVLLLRFNRFDATAVRWMRAQLTAHGDASGVVIDLRQNRGGLVRSTQQAVGLFFEKPVPLGVVVARDGRRWTERSRPGRFHADMPTAVLIGRGSHSSAEVFAYAMQYHRRAVLVGRRTAGEVLGARRHRLRDGGGLFVSETDFLRLEGGRLEGAGVAPDVSVAARESCGSGGEDADLDAALAMLRTTPAACVTR